MEVADATLAFDRERKARLYARANIQDYWVLNLADKQLEVYHTPVTSGQLSQYRAIRTFSASQAITPLGRPDTPIAVTDLLP